MERRAFLRLAAAAGLVGAAGLGSTGCSSGADGPQQDGSSAEATGPVKLVYWSWAPQIESIIEIWNKSRPDIQVEVSTAAGFAEFNAKLLAAYKAGNPPDVNNTSYQNLPMLVANGVVADLTQQLTPLQSEFSPVAWQMVSFDDAVYGVPQATTPNLFLYRQDLFDKYDLSAPTSWDEYVDVATKLRSKDSDAYLANLDLSGSFGFFAGIGQQFGNEPWTYTDGKWQVHLNSPQAKELTGLWGELISSKSVSTLKGGSPEYNAAVADGAILSTIDSVWAPISMAGFAPDTKDKWGVTMAPQHDPKSPVSGVLGGSATVVSSITKHPKQAAEFAQWLNASDESLRAYISKVSIFPAKLSARNFPELQTPPPLVSNVKDFFQIAADVDKYSKPLTWGPNAATAQEIFGKEMGDAVAAGGSASQLSSALDRIQDQVVADLQSNGYEVAS